MKHIVNTNGSDIMMLKFLGLCGPEVEGVRALSVDGSDCDVGVLIVVFTSEIFSDSNGVFKYSATMHD